jgi:hypothetical protein
LIVDRDDFDVRVMLGQRRMDRIGGVVTFVVARDQDRDQRLAFQWRRQRVVLPRPVTLPQCSQKYRPPAIHNPGHEQRVEEHEVHQELPGDQEDQAQRHAEDERQNKQG